MKFKMPDVIGSELWYGDSDCTPICAVGHLADQLGYSYREYLDSDQSIDSPFYFVRNKLDLTDVEIEGLQRNNDVATTQEQRKEIFREFLASHGHEIEENGDDHS